MQVRITRDGWLFIRPEHLHLTKLLRCEPLKGHEGKVVHEEHGEFLIPPSRFLLLIPGNIILDLEFDGVIIIDPRTRKVVFSLSP